MEFLLLDEIDDFVEGFAFVFEALGVHDDHPQRHPRAEGIDDDDAVVGIIVFKHAFREDLRGVDRGA